MKMKKVFSLLTKGDKVLLALLLIFSLCGIGASVMGKPAFDGKKRLVVEVDGIVVEEIPFSPVDGVQVIGVPLKKGMAYIEIEDGKRARVRPMPDELCPLKVCSRRGWIEGPGEVIVCVPNRMVVRIVAENSTPRSVGDGRGVDAITY